MTLDRQQTPAPTPTNQVTWVTVPDVEQNPGATFVAPPTPVEGEAELRLLAAAVCLTRTAGPNSYTSVVLSGPLDRLAEALSRGARGAGAEP